jgi:prepilin-type N-terminal cleavage/methylation domain-containing protein
MNITQEQRDRQRFSRRRRVHETSGFSLIEVMIAMTIIAVGLLIAAQTIPLALMATAQGGVRTNAVQVAQQRLEDLRAQDYYSGALTAGVYSATDGNYNLSWSIQDSVPVPRSKRVELTASWQNSKGTQEATLTTYISAHN